MLNIVVAVLQPLVNGAMDVSGRDKTELLLSKDIPDENVELESSSEDVSVGGGTTFDGYINDYDFYYPLPSNDEEESFSYDEKSVELPDDLHEKPVELSDDLQGKPVELLHDLKEKPATPLEDVVQDEESILLKFRENNFSRGESPVAVKRERGVDNSVDNSCKSEETQGGATPVGVSEGPPEKASSEKTEVNIKIASKTVAPTEEVSDTQTVASTTEILSKEQRENIWQLAKKLCEARCSYNQNVCRPKAVNQKVLPMKIKKADTLVASCTRSRRRDTMTNGGVCTIGKGDDSQYEDPPDWDWGQPLPKEICEVVSEVIPYKPAPETPTITLEDDDCPTTSSSACFEKTSSPRRKRLNPRSKSLKISISMTTSKNSSDTTIILSDSEEELPDFTKELGISPRKRGTHMSERFDLSSDGGSCTVIHSVAPRQMAPTTRSTVRKRRRATENRAPGGRSFPNRDPNEVVVLELSDESDDSDVGVIPVAKKPAPSEAPKIPSKPEADNESKEWCCPICLESKDKVANIMSTTCGHIFCGPCLQSTIRINKQCPNCRKKLTLRQIHNLYM